MSFPKYPAYKDSGVEWLGEVPEHWHAIALSRVLAEPVTDGPHTTPEFQDDGVPFLSVDGIQNGRLTFEGCRYVSFDDHKEFSKKAAPKYNDLLMGKAASVGKIARVTENIEFSIWSPLALIRADVEKCAPEFLEFCLKSSALQHQILLASNSNTQLNIGMKDIPKLRIPLPGTQEQTQIARFLDHETARIDALIEEQQRLIELLKEKRQAVISHAVTKGLDPTVPMKDSGVEWLGEVPAHWVVAQLKFSAMEMQTGPFGSQLHAEDYVDSGIPLINPAHMIEGKIIHDPRVTVDEQTWRRLKRHALAAGDMIFARRGELGRCAIVTEGQEGWLCGTGSLKVKLGKQLDAEYAYLLITSPGVVSELSLESKGSTMENLNTETLGRIRLPLPPVNEQKAILEHVNNVAGQFGELIYTAENGIRLMVERRSALISAAVTGKIDVRNWQPPAGQYPAGNTQNRTEPEVV